MTRLVETILFTAIAIGLHLAMLIRPQENGVASGGIGGEELISLEAASASIISMVETWDRPAEVQAILEMDRAPSQADISETTPLPSLELGPAPRAPMRIAAINRPSPPDTISLETAPPPPPAENPEPEIEEIDQEAVDSPKPSTLRPPPARPVRKTPAKPPAPSKLTTPGRAEQRAAGSGGGTQAGEQGKATAATGSHVQQRDLKAIWGGKIRARLARQQRYPRGLRKNGKTGIVLTVARTGQLLDVRIGKSSGIPELDRAALEAARRAGRMARAPNELVGDQFRFTLVLDWRR